MSPASNMPSLLTLPTELRHKILLEVLPPTLTTSSPLPIQLLTLLTINHQLRLDTVHLIPTWSPTHILTHAYSPHTISISHAGQTYTPKCDHITLDIFATSDATRIQNTCYCSGTATYSHPEIVASWTRLFGQSTPYASLRSLQGIKTLALNVTPAPPHYRTGHRLKLNHFVGMKCTQTFLSCHVQDLGLLVGTIRTRFPELRIELTGALSVKAQGWFVEGVGREAGVEGLEYTGRWVSREEARMNKITTAVHDIVSKQQVMQAERKGEVHPMKWLRDVRWSESTKWTWASFADDGGDADARVDLRGLVEFVGSEKSEMEMGCAGTVRRALQHRVAEQLGLVSWSAGGEGKRGVVVGRKGNKKAVVYQKIRAREMRAMKGVGTS